MEVAETKPLRLKTARVPNKPTRASERPYASVLVETPAFHLDQVYDYLIPIHLSELVVEGSLVQVPFATGMQIGYVIKRYSEAAPTVRLKYIEKVLSALPVMDQQTHRFLSTVATRYGARVWDVLRSAIPDRVGAEEKSFGSELEVDTWSENLKSKIVQINLHASLLRSLNHQDRIRWNVIVSPGNDLRRMILGLLSARLSFGQVLIVAPDEKDVSAIGESIERNMHMRPLLTGSHLPKSARYRNFLITRFGVPAVIVGTRSSIFSQLHPNSTIIVLDDGDESHYERRYPTWNTRDVALLRHETSSLIFLSHAPSLEIARLTDEGWLTEVRPLAKPKIRIHPADGKVSVHQVISNGLSKGSVLVSTGSPGYANGFLCAKCRNPALCDCGGRLAVISAAGEIACHTCGRSKISWSCRWCSGTTPHIIKRGVRRLAQEYGRIFPNSSIIVSTGDHPVAQLPAGRHLVLATIGCEPFGEYAAEVMLDGEQMLNRIDLRSYEEVRRNWFRELSMLAHDGTAHVSLSSGDPLLQSMLQLDPKRSTAVELVTRFEGRLPPYFRLASISGQASEIVSLVDNLKKDDRFEVLGPVSLSDQRSRMIVKVDVRNSEALSEMVSDLQRYRSLRKLTPFDFRLDPYSLLREK